MRCRALVLLLAVALATPAAGAAFVEIPPLLKSVSRSSGVHARSVSCWPGGILLAGSRDPDSEARRRGAEPEYWIAAVDGAAVRELTWPPAYLNVPAPAAVRTCGAVGARAAVVAEGWRERRRISRLLLWDGREWEMLPLVNGTISSAVEHEGRIVIGGDFPVNSTTALHAMLLSDGEWLPLGGGLPRSRTSVEILRWQDALVAVGRPEVRASEAVTCLWRWRHGQWDPLGPKLRFWGRMVRAVVWNDRLVVGGTFDSYDGIRSDGLIMLETDGNVSVPQVPEGRDRPGIGGTVPRGVWDGRLVLAPLSVSADRTSLLLFDGRELTRMPGLPSLRLERFPLDAISVCGREMAILSFGDFAGAGIPREPVDGRRRLACWRDGSWWVPSLAALEE